MRGFVIVLLTACALDQTAEATTPSAGMKLDGVGTKRHLVFDVDAPVPLATRATRATQSDHAQLAIGVPVRVRVPSSANDAPIYDGAIAPRAYTSGLEIARSSQPHDAETFVVTCTRPGTFTLTFQVVGLDQRPLRDTLTIACIAPRG